MSALLANNRLLEDVNALQKSYGDADSYDIIKAALERFGERFSVVSSFGAESAVLLHQVSRISKDVPVLFLDTGKLFGETKRYREHLIDHLCLRNVQVIEPDERQINAEDAKGDLWLRDHSRCCFIRKVLPFNLNLQGFDAWGSGRKRYQGQSRAKVEHFEYGDGRVKVNPLAHWTSGMVADYRENFDLPQHPLIKEGFKSIGCMPCTDKVASGADDRSGRWKGKAKTECGIHLSLAQNVNLASSI